MYKLLERIFLSIERKRLKRLFDNGVPSAFIIYDSENEGRPYQCKRCGVEFGYWQFVHLPSRDDRGYYVPMLNQHVCEDLL